MPEHTPDERDMAAMLANWYQAKRALWTWFNGYLSGLLSVALFALLFRIIWP